METSSSSEQAPVGAPRVSVVVPAHNRAHLIGLTLDSVIGQTLEQWELVIFDDGSTDDTLEVARSYAEAERRIRVFHGPQGGVAAARNRGLRLTNPESDFVIFLDSDDLWEPDTLETLVTLLDAHPEYVGAHCTARCIDDKGDPVPNDDLETQMRTRHGFREGRVVTVPIGEPTTFAELAYHNCVVTPGTQLLRREVLRRVGEFDLDTDPADDADLTIRVSRYGDLGFVPRPLLQWRQHPDTLRTTSSRWKVAARRVQAKALIDPTNTPAHRQAMRQAYGFGISSALHEAGDALRRREMVKGLRMSAKAADFARAYASATLRMYGRRVMLRVRRPDPFL